MIRLIIFASLLSLAFTGVASQRTVERFDPAVFFGVGLGTKVDDVVDVDDLHVTQTDGGLSYDVEGLKLLNAHSFWGFRIDSLHVNQKTEKIHGLYASTIVYEKEERARRVAKEARVAIERITGCDGSPSTRGSSQDTEECETIAHFSFPRVNGWYVCGEIKLYAVAAGYFASLRIYSLSLAFEGHKTFSSMSGNYMGGAHRKQAIAGAFSVAKDKIVIIVTSKGSGSGFIAQDCGKKYLYTNRHVVSGAKSVGVKFLDGSRLQLGDVEVAKGLDLVRFEVSPTYPALEFDETIPDIGERIVTFGNSAGTGVCTEIQGLINGVGPTAVETDAEFVKGNSGSPMLAANYKVVAIATFVVDGKKTVNWTNEGTRFSKTRRFGLRVAGVEWSRMRWVDFVKETEDE